MEIKIGKLKYNLISANDETMKKCFEADYKTDDQKKEHAHRKAYIFSAATQTFGTFVYPVLDLSVLRAAGYVKLIDFLRKSFEGAGVRPDTPFHANDEGRYQSNATNSYRYMELNTIGGGMRLVFDSSTSHIFLSAHYSDPALVHAAPGSVDRTNLDNLAVSFMETHKRIQRHSDGTVSAAFTAVPPADREQLQTSETLSARMSPAFIAWLRNKNSGQEPGTIEDWYGLRI